MASQSHEVISDEPLTYEQAVQRLAGTVTGYAGKGPDGKWHLASEPPSGGLFVLEKPSDGEVRLRVNDGSGRCYDIF